MTTHLKRTLATGAVLALVAIGGLQAQNATQRANQGHGHDHAAHHGQAEEHARMFQSVNRAVAVLAPTQGNDVRGVVLFEEQSNGRVKVTAEVVGLKPDSKHGFHIHQYGDLTSADGTSAGGHYNPGGHEHGLPDEQTASRHAGDMGNLEADGQGRARYEETFDNFTIAGLENPILGRGVVVHAEPDDGGQPTGNAGGRIAVGVVGIAQPADQDQ